MKATNPHTVKLLVGWLTALSILLVAIAVVANFGLGEAAMKEEVSQHWKAAGEADLPQPARNAAPGAGLERAYNTVAAAMDRATVGITVQRVDPGTGTSVQNLGSGFFVAPGYVLTNYHVVEQAASATVTMHSPSEAIYPATLALYDAASDLAVLKVHSPTRSDVLPRGNSDQVHAGDIVMAVGNMVGLGNTFTSGVVADRRNSFVVNGRQYPDMLQTDVTLNHGSSGGPLVNLRGEVIGINTAIYTPGGAYTGIGFAIPINAARPLIQKVAALGAGTDAVPARPLAQASTPDVTLAAGRVPRQALLVCPSCQSARYVRCPICQQRLVLDANGHMGCPAGHDVTVNATCPRCGGRMTTAPPGGQPFSLAV
jgi:S1-C subfamily serine protease